MNKFQITFEIVKAVGLLYEVGHQGPKKLGTAMERMWDIEDSFDSPGTPRPNEAAIGLLECVYNDAPVPEWLGVAEGLME